MRAKRPVGGGKGRGKAPKPRTSPRGGLPPAAPDDGRGLPAPGQSRHGSPARDSGQQPRLSSVVSGEFGGHADTECREWLKSLDVSDELDGHLDSGVLLVVGRESMLESVCLPEGSDRFRFIGALRLLAHRLERGMVDND